MTWNELKEKVERSLLREGLTGDIDVALDMEPDQDVKNWGFSTRFDGKKSLMLTSREYDLDKNEWLMTCIRCDQVSVVYGRRSVCYTCDPVLHPRNPESYHPE